MEIKTQSFSKHIRLTSLFSKQKVQGLMGKSVPNIPSFHHHIPASIANITRLGPGTRVAQKLRHTWLVQVICLSVEVSFSKRCSKRGNQLPESLDDVPWLGNKETHLLVVQGCRASHMWGAVVGVLRRLVVLEHNLLKCLFIKRATSCLRVLSYLQQNSYGEDCNLTVGPTIIVSGSKTIDGTY